MNLPNTITLARLALTVVYVAAACGSGTSMAVLALVSFSIAAATDWLDGYLARKMNLVTALGKLLDPLVDKILVCTAFLHMSVVGLCPMWITALIVAREFLVTGLRQLAIERGIVIAADRWGKLKTIFQIIFLIACLLWIALESCSALAAPRAMLHSLLPALMWASLALTILSGLNYLKASSLLFRDSA